MPETEPETYTLEQAAESLEVSADDVRAYIDEGLVAPDQGEANRPVQCGKHFSRNCSNGCRSHPYESPTREHDYLCLSSFIH